MVEWWMCGTSLREKKNSAELMDTMGIETIGGVLKRNRLGWFGHVERKESEDKMHGQEGDRERPGCKWTRMI